MASTAHPAISAIIKVLADAIKDKSNPLGTGKLPDRIGAYGTLFWDLFVACRNVKDLPIELRTLSQEDALPIVNEVMAQFGVTSVHAQSLVDGGTKLLGAIVKQGLASIESLASAVKDESVAKKIAQQKVGQK